MYIYIQYRLTDQSLGLTRTHPAMIWVRRDADMARQIVIGPRKPVQRIRLVHLAHRQDFDEMFSMIDNGKAGVNDFTPYVRRAPGSHHPPFALIPSFAASLHLTRCEFFRGGFVGRMDASWVDLYLLGGGLHERNRCHRRACAAGRYGESRRRAFSHPAAPCGDNREHGRCQATRVPRRRSGCNRQGALQTRAPRACALLVLIHARIHRVPLLAVSRTD